MAKKRMYSFAKEKHSGKGILSTILGTLSLVIFAVLAWLAYYLDGQGGVYLGSIGLLGMVFAVSSVVFGLMGFGENNVRYLFPKIGSILGDLRKCQGRIAGVRSTEQLVWHHFTVTFKRLAVERWREQYWKRETLSQWNDLHP